jgi:hypothetical protein
MALDRKQHIIGCHPMTIISDRQFINAATAQGDADLASTSIKRVFNKFTQSACRPLNHLTSSDLVNKPVRELPDHGHDHLFI